MHKRWPGRKTRVIHRRTPLLVVVGTVLMLVLAACGGGEGESAGGDAAAGGADGAGAETDAAGGGEGDASTDEPLQFRLANQESLYGIAAIVAEENGIFAEHGVEVEQVYNPSGADRSAFVVGGQSDATILGAPSSFRGAMTDDWRLVGVMSLLGSSNALACAPDAGVETVEDVAGKTVAAADGSTTYEIFVRQMLPSVGLSADDISLVNLDVSERTAAVIGGSADCMLNSEPFLTIAVNGGHVNVVEYYTEYDPYPLFIDVSTAKLESPDGEEATIRFLAALEEAGNWIEENPEETAAIYEEFYAANFGTQIEDAEFLPTAISSQGYDVSLEGLEDYLQTWGEISVEIGDIEEMPDFDEIVLWDLNAEAMERAGGGGGDAAATEESS